MITITSNIEQVIARATTLRDERIPAALDAALADTGAWRPLARESAQNAIFAVAHFEDWKHVPAFVKAVEAMFADGVLVLELKRPDVHFATVVAQRDMMGEPQQPGDRSSAWAVQGPHAAVENFGELGVSDVEKFKQQVYDWVRDEKRWDIEMDGEKTEENIFNKAEWMSDLLLGGGATPAEVAARNSLMKPILEYIRNATKGEERKGGLSAATANEWLRAVLAAWRVLVRKTYPAMVREHLHSPSPKSMRMAA